MSEKGVTSTEFTNMLVDYLKNGHCDCGGFVIPWKVQIPQLPNFTSLTFRGALFEMGLDFSNVRFSGQVNFSDCRFVGSVDFRGCVFSSTASFQGAKFLKSEIPNANANESTRFDEARFEGSVSFDQVTFECDSVRFDRAVFSGEKATFNGLNAIGDRISFFETQFETAKTRFDDATINGQYADFTGLKVMKGWLSFARASFCGMEEVRFDGARLTGPNVSFSRCVFNCSLVSFLDVQFSGEEFNFTGAEIRSHKFQLCDSKLSGRCSFIGIHVSGYLLFFNLDLSQITSFRLQSINWNSNEDSLPTVVFKNLVFKPFATFFDEINLPIECSGATVKARPIVAFRYCNLQAVYFSDCNMSLFSFYKSAFFEEAFFTSGHWPSIRQRSPFLATSYDRRYVIPEDVAIQVGWRNKAIRKELMLDYKIAGREILEFPSDCGRIAELYVRLKRAADNAKDYHLASWFYFNEFEMKRKAKLQQIASKKRVVVRLFCRAVNPELALYRVYKALAGYGEKPLWSIVWFGIATISFAIAHLLNGFGIKQKNDVVREICYTSDFCPEGVKTLFSWDFIHDGVTAACLSLYCTIPTSLRSGIPGGFFVTGTDTTSIVISLANSVVLLILAVFIGVGLKRHFRRF